jgi:hypothetical protein
MTLLSVCLCIPTFFVLYVVRDILKESRRLILHITSCFKIYFFVTVSIRHVFNNCSSLFLPEMGHRLLS